MTSLFPAPFVIYYAQDDSYGRITRQRGRKFVENVTAIILGGEET